MRQDDGCFVLGYVGQLIERKDLSCLLKAAKILIDKQVKLRLVIIGDGPKLDELKDEAGRLGIDNVTDFMGFRADAIRHLKTFDAFALPSRLEGIPRCVMESMAVGVPVVVSDIPGNRSLVMHGQTGFLFELGESSDLAEKVHSLVNNREKARIMGLRAQEKIEKEFSNRRMAREYSDIYGELTNS